MSAAGLAPPPREAAPTAVEIQYAPTDSFVALLHQLGVSLLVSTYQANKLLVVRAAGSGLSTLVRTFEPPMGLAVDARRMALGTADFSELFLAAGVYPVAQRGGIAEGGPKSAARSEESSRGQPP